MEALFGHHLHEEQQKIPKKMWYLNLAHRGHPSVGPTFPSQTYTNRSENINLMETPHFYENMVWLCPFGWLYTFHISRFVGISWMFLQNTPWNTKHSQYPFCISCKLRVLLMSWKNKPRNPLTFRANAYPGAKCKKSEKRDAKHEKSATKYFAIHFLFFTFRVRFRIFCDKCTASLRGIPRFSKEETQKARKTQ